MQNTEIVYSALNENYTDYIEKCNDKCLICGKEIQEGVKIKKALSSNFTNWDLCKSRMSKYICKECTASLKNTDLRRNNIISDKSNCYLLKKNDLENYLFNLDKYVKGEFIVCITTTFKKHNVFRARVNNNTKSYYIRQEDKEFKFNVDEMKNVYDKLNTAYLQFSKDEIKTGNYNMLAIQQFGIDRFIEYEEIFKKYRGGDQFELLLFILNSERRNEYIKEKQAKEKELKKQQKANKSNKNEGEQLCMI